MSEARSQLPQALCAVLLCFALAGCASAASVLFPVTHDALKAKPGDYEIDPHHTQVVFGVEHLGFSTYYGRFARISGRLSIDPAAPAASEVAVSIAADSVDTPSDELDRQLRAPAFFDSDRYPEIIFVSKHINITGDNKADIEGVLTIRDVSRPFIIHAMFHGAGTDPANGRRTVGFDATATLRRSEFGLNEWRAFVGDDVKLIIEAEFIKAN